MIVGIGLDIVTVSRISRWLDDRKLCERYFHAKEMEDVRSRGGGAARSLAARFAAKEAFGKALGTGFAGFRLRDVRVESEGNGRPRLVIEDTAALAMNAVGADRAHISLTHDGDLAAAQVILEA
jgi:holo-[acyl-carrier protein] synthase